MEGTDKRLLMLENFMRGILSTNKETLEELNKTFSGIREYKKYTDEEFSKYLDVVTSILVPKVMEVEKQYRIFINDIKSTIDYFNDDLEYMKICADQETLNIDMVEVLGQIKRRIRLRKNKELDNADYCAKSWELIELWLESIEAEIHEAAFSESIGDLNEEDAKYINLLKRSLLYNKVILDRLDRNNETVNSETFARMWGQENEDDDDDKAID